MREIKFRAWDKVCKEMFYSGELANGDIIVLHLDGRLEISDDDTYKPEDFVLMQYTGLKDKNGREIYEGDICEDARGFRFVVFWDDDARFLGRGIGAQQEYIRYVGQEPAVRVIGNIYQTPELLEGVQG